MTDPTPAKPKSKHLRNAGIAALAMTLVSGFEGLRQSAYPDPATRGKPWTICYGHTGPEVTPGERASLAECKALLLADLDREAVGIEKCVTPTLTNGQYVAVLSLAHNIGVAATCRSSVVVRLNRGDVQGGCDALLYFDHAGGIVFPGLKRRREQERAICLKG